MGQGTVDCAALLERACKQCAITMRKCPGWQEQEVRESDAVAHRILKEEAEITASLERKLAQTVTDLQIADSALQQFEQSSESSQQQFQKLEQEHAALNSEAGRLSSSLTEIASQLSDIKQHLADSEKLAASLRAQYEVTDQDKHQMQKQLTDARTGIRNLRNRLDESESDLKKTRVQSSLQV